MLESVYIPSCTITHSIALPMSTCLYYTVHCTPYLNLSTFHASISIQFKSQRVTRGSCAQHQSCHAASTAQHAATVQQGKLRPSPLCILLSTYLPVLLATCPTHMQQSVTCALYGAQMLNGAGPDQSAGPCPSISSVSHLPNASPK